MSTVYYFYIGTPVNYATLVTELNNKITIDLELKYNYTSVVYNNPNIEVTYTLPLSNYKINILNNLTAIILYNQIPSVDVYVVNYNECNRCSLGVIDQPSIYNDIDSGYTNGSMVTRNNNDIFICTDATLNNAVWVQLNRSYLGESSATGTYSWGLTQNTVYNIGLTAPTNSLTTILSPSPNSFWQLSSGALQYIGISTISVSFTVSLNFTPGVDNRNYTFNMLLNGTIILNTAINTITTTTPVSITFKKVVQVSTNNILSTQVVCSSAGGDTMTLTYYNLSVLN